MDMDHTKISTQKRAPAYTVCHALIVDLPLNQCTQAHPPQANVQPSALKEQSRWWRIWWMETFYSEIDSYQCLGKIR